MLALTWLAQQVRQLGDVHRNNRLALPLRHERAAKM